MTKVNVIKETWGELAEAQVPGVIKRALDISSSLKMFCTYKSPDGFCGIAFSFNQDINLDISPFYKLSEIGVSLFNDSSFPESKFLLIQLINKDARIREIFAAICDNLVDVIQTMSSEKESIQMVVKQMRKWQSLFSTKIKTSLSTSEQQGLFGELLFFQKLISSSIDKERVVEFWVGPNMASQDYQGESWAVEVKTVSANKFPNVSINGELQLDDTTKEELFLYNIVVEILPADGKTLPELIGELRECLEQDVTALNIFENRLIHYGYFDIDADIYKGRQYQIRKETFYKVQGEFPRIKKSDLLLGVSEVKYNINLAVSTENIIEESNVLNTIISYEGNK